MRALYFDCFSGISGDMALGALFDCGLTPEQVRHELEKLPITGWVLDARREQRSFLSGMRALVDAPEQPTHRHLADVQAIIAQSSLSSTVQTRSLQVFRALAEAEGQVHGISPEQVHFHEVGALDAIVDIVGVVAGLELLGIEAVYASPLPLGSGWVRAAHGQIPVPAPATLALLATVQAPTIPDDSAAELVTPTGAALLATLATFRRPAIQIERVGYGLGKRDLPRPNALRAWIGTVTEAPQPADVLLLETNIDDQPAEQLAYVVEQLFALGALDVWQSPIVMKKGRAALRLSVLLPVALEAQATQLLFRETSTFGIRRQPITRHVADRTTVTITTPLGPVRCKRKQWLGETLGVSPEYEDCRMLAQQHQLPLQVVYQMVLELANGTAHAQDSLAS